MSALAGHSRFCAIGCYCGRGQRRAEAVGVSLSAEDGVLSEPIEAEEVEE